jgi:hypothetical protein
VLLSDSGAPPRASPFAVRQSESYKIGAGRIAPIIETAANIGAVASSIDQNVACLNGAVALGAAFLVAEIGTWEKTLFVALLAAMTLSYMAVFWRQFRELLRSRNILVAILSFTIGAAPLIAFTLRHRGATFTASRYLPVIATSEKLMMLRHTLDGRALEHYMFRSVPEERIPLTGLRSIS